MVLPVAGEWIRGVSVHRVDFHFWVLGLCPGFGGTGTSSSELDTS